MQVYLGGSWQGAHGAVRVTCPTLWQTGHPPPAAAWRRSTHRCRKQWQRSAAPAGTARGAAPAAAAGAGPGRRGSAGARRGWRQRGRRWRVWRAPSAGWCRQPSTPASSCSSRGGGRHMGRLAALAGMPTSSDQQPCKLPAQGRIPPVVNWGGGGGASGCGGHRASGRGVRWARKGGDGGLRGRRRRRCWCGISAVLGACCCCDIRIGGTLLRSGKGLEGRGLDSVGQIVRQRGGGHWGGGALAEDQRPSIQRDLAPAGESEDGGCRISGLPPRMVRSQQARSGAG